MRFEAKEIGEGGAQQTHAADLEQFAAAEARMIGVIAAVAVGHFPFSIIRTPSRISRQIKASRPEETIDIEQIIYQSPDDIVGIATIVKRPIWIPNGKYGQTLRRVKVANRVFKRIRTVGVAVARDQAEPFFLTALPNNNVRVRRIEPHITKVTFDICRNLQNSVHGSAFIR